ncbi:LLM class F420-dependent oxidoreductase [Planosporangium thailandense]|uniref:LLM class F420-dependent oxidoreductase n=1 Tax=Planosporangium thailandense TaxID=765197 RepID=A0ABX0YA56_9ACTN|nr:LLM class F420-dependent oxidoreductase [Planosporangium thailandense]NJC74262.1 LLM class F420-dependent oxidoreductase [Planosporangium thailandense]
MKVDRDAGTATGPASMAGLAADAERAGYDAVWLPEASHDPFIGLALASPHTERVELGTAITVAFARNPMTTAYLANDLQSVSKGRFILGLGSQIQPHITKRFSMPWSHPAPRMREYVSAIRAIWESWATGERLNFRGDFYTHTLMTPFFNPGPNPYGNPKIFLAGVGEHMTTVAGEVADGFLCHAFTTERYLREVTLPALRRGREKVGSTLDGFEICGPSFVVTGNNEQELTDAVTATRKQIAFYGSTPAYRNVLELHGWGDLHGELNRMSKQGRWDDMTDAIDDEVLRAFAVVGEPERVADEILRRYGDVVTRISFYAPYESDPDRWAKVFAALQAAGKD